MGYHFLERWPDIEDPHVRQLADAIIEAQKREIKERQTLVRELE